MIGQDFSAVQRTCWWACGADGRLLLAEDCAHSERYRFAAIGMMILIATCASFVCGFMIARKIFQMSADAVAGDIFHVARALLFSVAFSSSNLLLLRLSVSVAGRRTDRLNLLSFDVLRAVSIILVTGVLASAVASAIQVSVTAADIQTEALAEDQLRALVKARSANIESQGGSDISAALRLTESSARKTEVGYFRQVSLAYKTNSQLCWAVLIIVWLLIALPPVIRLFGDRGPYDFLVAHRNRAVMAAAGIEVDAFTIHAPDGAPKRMHAFHSAGFVLSEKLDNVFALRRRDFEELQHQSLRQPFGVHPSPSQLARKRPVAVKVEIVSDRRTVETLQGPVVADAGDAVVTAQTGESWPVARSIFMERYRPGPQTIDGHSGVYLARPIPVRVAQLTYPVSVLTSGGRSRLEGKIGDWFIDYGNGTLGIVATEIFKNTYEIIAEEGAKDDALRPMVDRNSRIWF